MQGQHADLGDKVVPFGPGLTGRNPYCYREIAEVRRLGAARRGPSGAPASCGPAAVSRACGAGRGARAWAAGRERQDVGGVVQAPERPVQRPHAGVGDERNGHGTCGPPRRVALDPPRERGRPQRRAAGARHDDGG
jgi:hypothetical protein